jgi:DNA segregation ATPase FtsK/SpoIIIE, S-DNA-T family
MATAKNGKNSKKSAPKSRTQKSQSKPQKGENAKQPQDNTAKRQLYAIVLFCVSLLLLCLVFIKGESLWGLCRELMFGLFGFTSFIWPIILIYIAVMATLNKIDSKVGYKVAEAALLTVLISSAIHIFSFKGDTVDYFHDIADAYNYFRIDGSVFGSGAVGAILGGAILLITGSAKVPSAAIILVLIFLAVMLVTGTTLIKLINGFVNPAKKIGKMTNERVHERFSSDGEDEEETEETPENDDVISYEEAQKKRKAKKQIDFVLPAEESGEEIPQAVEPLNSKPVQLDDIIKNMNSGNAEPKKAEPVKPAAEKTAEIKANDIPLGTENKNDGENAEKAEDNYVLPTLDCLAQPKVGNTANYEEELKNNATKLVDTLKSFGVETRVVDISRGPSVTRYEIQPAAGVKISRITSLSDDIALNLAASGVRIEAPIPNKAAVGIEVPNKNRATVSLRELVDTDLYKKSVAKSKLSVALGKDIAGNCMYADLAKMPHLLVAGTTGSGKSVCMNSMIVSILYNAKPDEVKLLMIDPKQVEFTVYNGIPHLIVPVVSDPRKAAGALAWAVTEMLQRYKMFSENNVRDIEGYNSICASIGRDKLPQIVIFIDELSDLMMASPHEVEDSICRLAQMARAAGMHLVIATQRPSVDVITGLIKANIPSRLTLKTSSQIDSRTIIDSAGAEKLLGNGDMLFYPVGIAKPLRIQGCFLSDKEVENVVDFIKSQQQSEYSDDVMQEIERQAALDKKKNGGTAGQDDDPDSEADEMLPKAIEIVVENQMASTTLLQKKLKLGYARASRIIDDLEERGIIGPFEGSKPRKVLISKQQWYEMNALAQGGTAEATDATDILSVDDEISPIDTDEV